MDAHHQQSNAANMHQQHTVLEQRNPEVSTKNRSGGGGGAKTSKKRKRNQDLGPGAPRQPVNGRWFGLHTCVSIPLLQINLCHTPSTELVLTCIAFTT